MLPKKYIFETKKTKFHRLIFNSFIMGFFAIALIVSLCVYIPIYAAKENEASTQELFQTAPDLVAIFTGDSGRIEYGIKLASEYPSSLVLISGVYTMNNLQTIMKKQNIDQDNNEKVEEKSNFIELDYQAQNTIENIIYTLRLLKEKKNLKHVLIISSDYHILRIKMLLNAIRRDDDPYRFYFHGIETDYSQWKNIKKLVLEIFKLGRGIVVSMFWETRPS